VSSADESFTPAGYRALLEAGLASGYAFCPFDDPGSIAEPRALLLRHDVDADPGAALELARLEHELGVSATYFFMLRSPLYNLFGRDNVGIVTEIVALGHGLGLHYDVAFVPSSRRSPEEWIDAEARVLSEMFGEPVRAVSFHQPGASPDPGAIRIGSLVNSYGLPGFHYLTDTNRVVDAADLVDALRTARHPRVQLLVHPMWWVADEAGTTEDAWDRALLANLERSQAQLLATERAFGSPRTFTIARTRR